MTRLDDNFEDDLRDALMDEAEDQLYAERDNLAFGFLQRANTNLRGYGTANDYDVEPVAQSGKVVSTSRRRNRVSATVEWDHDAAGLFESGVSPHRIDGRPILSFIWENAPQSVKELFPNTERVNGDPRVFLRSVDHPGLPAARYIRRAIQSFRATLRRRGPSGRFQ